MIAKLIILSTLALALKVSAAPVEIEVTNVRHTAGTIRISMFATPESWDAETPTSVPTIFPVVAGTSTTTIDLEPGEYGFFLYNDVNNDGVLQKTWIGMPNEPYAFSNNLQLNMSKPTFDQMKFTVTKDGAKQSVKLIDP